MDKKGKNTKAPENTRKTTRSGSLKSSVGSVAAESSPTPVEAPSSRSQNTGVLLKNQLLLNLNQLRRLRRVNPRLVNLKLASQGLTKEKVQAKMLMLERWTLLLC